MKNEKPKKKLSKEERETRADMREVYKSMVRADPWLKGQAIYMSDGVYLHSDGTLSCED